MSHKFPKSCRAEGFGPCSEIMSKEHVISKGLLNAFGKYTWRLEEGERVFGIGSFVTKTLCENHNQQLSKYDAEAIKFFTEWFRLSSGNIKSSDLNQVYSFNGDYIEKWFAKTLINFVVFKHQMLGNESYRPFNFAVRHVNEVLYDQESSIQFIKPFGIYRIIRNQADGKDNTIHWGPKYQTYWHQSNATLKWSKLEQPLWLSVSFHRIMLLGYFNVEHFVNHTFSDGVTVSSKVQKILNETNAKYRSFHAGFSRIENDKSKPEVQIKLQF